MSTASARPSHDGLEPPTVAELPASLLDPELARIQARQRLAPLAGIVLREGEPLSAHTPLRLGGPATFWVQLDDNQQLEGVLSAARRAGLAWQLCWPLQDLLVRDGGLNALVIRPGRAFEGSALLPADETSPARLRLGAAEPWAAARAVLATGGTAADRAESARGPLGLVSTWSGCPGGLVHGKELGVVEGLGLVFTWQRGHQVERTEAPTPPTPASVLLAVEIPLLPPPGFRRSRTAAAPSPPGAILVDSSGLALGPQLSLAGLPRTRLRGWRLAESEPGTIVNLGGGDLASLQLLVRGLAEYARRSRGLDLSIRLPVIGLNLTRRGPAPPRRS